MQFINPIDPKSKTEKEIHQEKSTYELVLPISLSLLEKLQAFENWQELALEAIATRLAILETPIMPDQDQAKDSLKSEKEIDYSNLRHLLASGLWKEADLETAEKMLLAMDKNKWYNVYPTDIDQFPCHDLVTIDRLWLKYSQGRFGFSVQKKIWETIQGDNTYELAKKLGQRVGWCKGRQLIDYSAFNFSLDAPVGHLPIRSNTLRSVWCGVLLERLFYRLDICDFA